MAVPLDPSSIVRHLGPPTKEPDKRRRLTRFLLTAVFPLPRRRRHDTLLTMWGRRGLGMESIENAWGTAEVGTTATPTTRSASWQTAQPAVRGALGHHLSLTRPVGFLVIDAFGDLVPSRPLLPCLGFNPLLPASPSPRVASPEATLLNLRHTRPCPTLRDSGPLKDLTAVDTLEEGGGGLLACSLQSFRRFPLSVSDLSCLTPASRWTRHQPPSHDKGAQHFTPR
ncbi:hypothetical protein F5Y17DRAFT_457402 [Xylariaceae sp. FL0594]|nr:hypothetical protein F5Y17DRAFT_457402 [Xylariaceae sp. FL0594]